MIEEVSIHPDDIARICREYPELIKTDNNGLREIGSSVSKAFRDIFSSQTTSQILGFWRPDTVALHVSGLSIDEHIPNTPYDGKADLSKIAQCVGNSIGLHDFIGLHPVVYYGENDGQLVRNVVPHRGATDDVSSHGSKKTFGPHVDNPDLPLFNNYVRPSVISPDTLSLYCVRQDPSVSTDLVLLDDVLSLLDNHTVEVLMMPIFKIKRPDSFTTGNKNNVIEQKPILEKDNYGNYVSRFDAHRVFSDYDVGNSAIEAFTRASLCDDVINNFYMKPGELLLFKNKRVLHSRKGFTPRFDGKDRWLIRVFGLYKQPDESVLLCNNDTAHLNTDLSAFTEQLAYG
ncbi:hypothetical protein [Microbulbifer sp. JMSA003]|uniref:hypothetical protein n=1 Tax=Microbulbifer sp. JMSA003 TaxID=3243369 RepID=UPI00403A48E6